MMQPWLPAKAGRMMDLGCHTGWFCREFKRAGWQTFGIERAPDWAELARTLDPQGDYLTADVFTVEFAECDVALCLSLAMYLFDDLERGWELFRRISQAAPLMFLDFGGMYANRLPFTESTVIEQMVGNTLYRDGLLLGRTAFEERPFFLFER